MKTLILLRHAKAIPSEAGRADRNRGLAPRGRTAAPVMGAWIAARASPDLVLVSKSTRTIATWDLIADTFAPSRVERRADLYLAETAALLAAVRASADSVGTVLVVGHNPGLHEFAMMLSGTGSRSALRRLADKFPTAAVALLTFKGPTWQDIEAGAGTLVDVETPRRVMAHAKPKGDTEPVADGDDD